MNLKEIREEINSALDYNPDLKQYTDNIARVVNRHYLQISSQYQWLFMQKHARLMFRANIEGSTTNVFVSDGSLKLSLPTSTGAGVVNLPIDIEGQSFVYNNNDYLITRRIDARTIILNRPIASANITDWKIEYTKYPMPRDCVEVLGIMDRGIKHNDDIAYINTSTGATLETTTTTTTAPNRGRFVFLDSRKEEYLYLDKSDTGDPFVSIEEMHENVQSPDYPPMLTIGPSPTARSVPNNITVEYCYTFLYAGRESPPSTVASISTGDSVAPFAIRVDNLPVINNYRGSSTYSGRMKKIYRRVLYSDELIKTGMSGSVESGSNAWRHVATLDSDSRTFDDDFDEISTNTVEVAGTFIDSVDTSGMLFDFDRLNESGPRQYLRFWYTPKSDYMVELRYHTRPYRLVKDSDSPNWPVQYHHYLVYAALRDICMQHGMTGHSQLYESRAAVLLAAMKGKYLTRTDRLHIRRGFDRAMADRERFGIPSKS